MHILGCKEEKDPEICFWGEQKTEFKVCQTFFSFVVYYMETTNKRKIRLSKKARNKALCFQVDWGVHALGLEQTEDVRARIDDELRILQNLDVSDDLLALKAIVEGVKQDLNALPIPFEGNLSGSLVAYCLGITTGNPLEKHLMMPVEDYVTPMQLSLCYNNDVINDVIEWVMTHGYKEVETQLGRPILRLDKMVVEFKPLVKE